MSYTNLGGTQHYICIVYRKDSSAHSGNDRGYLLAPKPPQPLPPNPDIIPDEPETPDEPVQQNSALSVDAPAFIADGWISICFAEDAEVANPDPTVYDRSFNISFSGTAM